MAKDAWVHLHLPRLRSGDPDPISLKIPGERIEYVNTVMLEDARFVVSEAGRQRALRDNVRNVHAWVVGQPVAAMSAPAEVREEIALGVPSDYGRAIYDPWKGDKFVDAETFRPLTGGHYSIIMVDKTVYYR